VKTTLVGILGLILYPSMASLNPPGLTAVVLIRHQKVPLREI